MATIETAYYVPTFLGLSTTLGISCAVSATCIIGFEICKRLDSMKCLFSPRTQLLKNPAPKQPSHLFSWISSTWYLAETDYIQKVGLDSTMHLRFIRMAIHFLIVQALIICPVLLTLHWFGASTSLDRDDLANEFKALAKNESEFYSTGRFHFNNLTIDKLGQPLVVDHFRSNSTLYYLSIANISNNNHIVWVHVLFTFSISLSWLWLLFVNHIHHIDLLQQQPVTNQLHERSVLITHVPHYLRNSWMLQHHFESADIGKVEKVTLVSNTVITLVEATKKKRKTRLDKLEEILIKMTKKLIKRGVLQREDTWQNWLQIIVELDNKDITLKKQLGKAVVLLKEIEEIDKEVKKQQDVNTSPEYYMPTGAAFVTFKSAHSAQICAQIVTSWKPGVFDIRMAPEPRDIIWRSLLRRGRRSRVMGVIRQWIVFAAVWSLTIFWLFPITFVLGLTSIQSLSQHFSFLRYFLVSSFVIRSFVQNILPTLLVTLFMSLLPWVVLEISKQQDFVSYSELEDAVLGRYYHFAIFNVLIVFLLGTTFLTTMLDVLYEPTMLIQLLANALPQGANFFLNYLLFNSSTHAMELIQLGSQLFGHLILTLPFISKTPRLLAQYTSPWSFPFYYYYPNHILVLVITLTYSVIQPLILFFSLFYFSFALIVYKHQYMYCYVKRYETGGSRHYKRMARYTSDGLIIFQLTMVGLLYLKGVITAATAVLPLIFFTIWVKVKFNQLFQDRTSHPYIGRFQPQQAHYSFTATKKSQQSQTCWRSVFLQADDIWKISYIRAWWASGRYAQHSCNNVSVIQLSTLENQLRESTQTSSDATTVNCDHNKIVIVEEEQAANYNHEALDSEDNEDDSSEDMVVIAGAQALTEVDLINCADESKSVYESYEHPALIEPLEVTLILPRDPSIRYWNLTSCVATSISLIKKILLTSSNDASRLEKNLIEIESHSSLSCNKI